MLLLVALVVYAVVPGYLWLCCFVGDCWQRLVFSVPLSLALVGVTVYLTNSILKVAISTTSVLAIITIYTLGGVICLKRYGAAKEV